jgi:ABC-type uncharacterized transport system permease subunit
MTEVVSGLTLALSVVLYAAASGLFYLDVARARGPAKPAGPPQRSALAPTLLTAAALGHAAYVGLASLVAHVCPIHSIHFVLSVASLFASAAYLTFRHRFHIEALGLLVSPLGLAFLLGTFFLGKPASPEPSLGAYFIAFHVLANMIGVALFLLAGAAAVLYLVQERRLKGKKKLLGRAGTLPPLDTLDTAEHRFLVAGFPLLTLGVITGTYWAHKLEAGSPEEVMRAVFGYATWLLIGGVLLLRAAAGWRGRRSAYGTIAGLLCAAAVLAIYLVRPSAPAPKSSSSLDGLAPQIAAVEVQQP